MAIAAQRFKFLDKETNVATTDFLNLTDNAVYTGVIDTADSAIASLKEGDSLLSKLGESIEDLLETVSKATTAVMRKIKDALNAAIDKLLNTKIPGFVTKILDSLKALDLAGVKAFFKDLLKVGSVFLCNNLDFLKSFMLGYSLTENILSGLIIGLLLSWLDRYCKGFTKEEVAAATNKGKLGMLFSYDGITLSPGTVLGKFSNMFADLSRYNATKEQLTERLSRNDFIAKALSGDKDSITTNFTTSKISSEEKKEYIAVLEEELTKYEPTTEEYLTLTEVKTDVENLKVTGVPDKDDFISQVLSGNGDKMLLNLRILEISSADKKKYTGYIDELLQFYQPGSPEYNMLLKIRGDLIKLPLISIERIEKANNYSNLKDAMGSLTLNLGAVDLSQINRHTLSEAEKSLLDKLNQLKKDSLESVDLQTRDHESGSFSDFNFDNLLPPLSEEELNYVNQLPGLGESHRYNNLHPTTEVFTEASMPGVTPTRPDTTPKPENLSEVPSSVSESLYLPVSKIPGNCHA